MTNDTLCIAISSSVGLLWAEENHNENHSTGQLLVTGGDIESASIRQLEDPTFSTSSVHTIDSEAIQQPGRVRDEGPRCESV
jgi:hypothetical protein